MINSLSVLILPCVRYWCRHETIRKTPGSDNSENELTNAEKELSTALMRVNHVGEVCAQALYQGQSLTARNEEVQKTLMKAAREETEHLAWTEQRIHELGGRKSFLNPLWYGDPSQSDVSLGY